LFGWRWAPCVGLTLGSLAFVAFSVLLIPAQFGSAPGPVAEAPERSFDRPSPPAPRALYGASLARGLPEFGQRSAAQAPPTQRPAPPPNSPEAVTPAPVRGFSPIVDRPEPPLPASAAEAPPAPPAMLPSLLPGPAAMPTPADSNVPPPPQ
jgi:hypothetical protein